MFFSKPAVAIDPTFRPRRGFGPRAVNIQNKISIPRPIFNEILDHPKFAHILEKLMEAAKIFFAKKKIISVRQMLPYGRHCRIGEASITGFKGIDINLKTTVCKFWPYDVVSFNDSTVDLNLFLSKIYGSNIKHLHVFVNIPSALYQALTSSGTLEKLYMCGEIQTYGTSASVDQLFANVGNLEELTWYFHRNASIKTEEDVNKFVHGKVQRMFLYQLPENLFPDFIEFFKSNKTVQIYLEFWGTLTDNYKEMLENFMKEAMETPLDNPPQINGCDSLDVELRQRYYNFYQST